MKKPAEKGRTLDDFRAAHDKRVIVPQRIKTALSQLGDSWEYENEFIRRSGVSQIDFAAYREQFRDFYVEVPGTNGMRPKRLWAGTKAFATKLRESLA